MADANVSSIYQQCKYFN